ncbi:MFS transporter [Streptomyces sp. TLI_105]|uniref:MFS transporter n=1 Tax=Streptomyces sp. TLI_105 TaxID=1881019 RepID=UPI00089A8B69|nr:MFS transporter [Streptomyces sp. TLI_105]SEC15208.1 Predicted arabinose efflux permease, MFS family [Streptomyces sp. TLI_105]
MTATATAVPAVPMRRAVFTISATRVVTSLGFYLSIPMLGVIALRSGTMSAADVGLLVATHALFRRAFSIPLGIACDRWGARPMLVGGLCAETIAYGLLAGGTSFPLWLGALVVDGLGGAAYNAGARLLLARVAQGNAASSFAGFYVATNLGALFGPLAAAALSGAGHPALPLALSAGAYGISTVAGFLVTRRITDEANPGARFGKAVLAPLRHRSFMGYCASTVPLWFGVSLLVSALPLEAELRGLSAYDVAVVNALNALVVVAFGGVVGRRADGWSLAARLKVLSLGSLTMSAGSLVCLAPGRPGLYGGLLLVTVGELALITAADVVAVQLAPPGETGAYLGYVTFAWAVGGVTAGVLAGRLLDVPGSGTTLFWLISAALGLAGAAALLRRSVRVGGAAHGTA